MPGERGGFWGDHFIFRRRKGGSVVTENPKGGITENFGRIQRRDHSNLLEKYGGEKNMGGGEIAKVIKRLIRPDHLSEVTFKGGSAKFHLI